jgi:ATP-dependent DNA helicase RecQ
LPKNIESYYQETGRAGRDGLPSEAVLLFGYGDIGVARGLIELGRNLDQKRIEIHKLNAMVAFAEAQSCRRQVLLGYFGELLPEPCGNCDICLDPPELHDVTDEARKALSCVYRVGQRFGMGHVIDVLRGSKSERIQSLKHDRLSTYGLGREQPKEFWSSILHHLVHHGYLLQDVANYSVLKLTDTARPLLRGEQQLTMAKPRARVVSAKKKEARILPDLAYNEELFEKLRGLRKELADAAQYTRGGGQ